MRAMFSRDGEFWSQLAAYLYAVIVALSVLYGIGQLLQGTLSTYLLNSDERASGIFFWMDCTRPNEGQRSNANVPSDKIAFFIDGAKPVPGTRGPVARLVGIEGGVVSKVINLESAGVGVPDRRPRHEQQYHEDTFAAV